MVNLVGDRAHGLVAESRFVDRPFLPGGEHNMYELAFAAASLGYEVELRGWLHRETFDRFRERVGAAPAVELEARRPEADDLLVVPEGWRDPLEYARILLSPASPALFVLAAPGLFGWPFAGGWQPPDPLTVPLDEVARPEHFAAAGALGFRLLTHSPALAGAAHVAGVDCAFVGTGRPGFAAPRPVEKEVDVVMLLENRWAALGEQVLEQLPDHISRDRIPAAPNPEVLAHFNRARVLLWPSRIEGHATIPWEARSVGCVPVALDTNRFAVGLDDAHGAALVEAVDQLAPAIEALLANGARWSALSELGRTTAPVEVDWEAYVERVAAFLSAPRDVGPERPALAAIGDLLETWLEQRAGEAQQRLSELSVAREDLTQATGRQIELDTELQAVRADRDAIHAELAAVTQDRDRLHEALLVERDALASRDNELVARRRELDRVENELTVLRSRVAVRTALRVARMLGR